MSAKRLIRAKDIVSDIFDGLSDAELMEKYKVSSRGLQSIFRKLIEAKAILPSELFSRAPKGDDTVAFEDIRQLPKNFVDDRMIVRDMSNPDTKCYVQTICENELQVTDIKAEVDEIRLLRIETEEFREVKSFEFYAVCRWVRKEEGNYITGFEITKISEAARAELMKLLHLIVEQTLA